MRISFRSSGWVLAAALSLLPSAIAGRASAADDATNDMSASGHWSLLLNETNRQCRIMLRPNLGPTKRYRLGLPAGCRRAIPILSSVSGWTSVGKFVRLHDDEGQPVLEFVADSDVARLTAKGPEGEAYSLVALDGAHIPVIGRAPATAQDTTWDLLVAQVEAPAPETRSAKTRSDETKSTETKSAERPVTASGAGTAAAGSANIAGRYAILRKGGKETGCVLTLDAKAKGPKGGKKANLAPACKDHGIVTFDPRGWRLDDDRLTLIAKKGHETHLEPKGSGTWLKETKEGTSLGLKKL